jgi:hypothetical protein
MSCSEEEQHLLEMVCLKRFIVDAEHFNHPSAVTLICRLFVFVFTILYLNIIFFYINSFFFPYFVKNTTMAEHWFKIKNKKKPYVQMVNVDYYYQRESMYDRLQTRVV